jgi:Kef-type K+ transport system membrane component KefB
MREAVAIKGERKPLKGLKNIAFYVLLIGGALGLSYFIVIQGSKLQIPSLTSKAMELSDWGWASFSDATNHNLVHPLAILLLQIITIILAAMALGYVFRKLRQPAVIGEIIAGIVLGPSLVGHYFPGFSAFLFPKASMPNLQFLSQIGLILFMFVIGMELDLKVLKNKAHEAVVISHASIVIPFTLGIGLSYFLYQGFAPAGVEFVSFALFIGIAMSITAFPVLARIVQERQMSKSKIGALVITCAAADDITAWCLLAAVIAIVKAGSFVSALYTIALAIVYVLGMVFLVRPFLKRVGDKYAEKEKLTKPIVSIFFITLLFSAYLSEVIGIHALFGAFMAGVIMPPNVNFRSIFIEKVEDISVVMLLPLFFVFTGLRTEIGLLNDINLWKVCAGIVLIAVAGKFLGSTLAAKFVGQSWRQSLVIGALMNTRGLMELVVLNIGYDLGVMTPEIFAMMVIMALVTTFMTGPSLDIINYVFKEKLSAKSIVSTTGEAVPKFSILIPFGTAASGRSMLRLAAAMVKKSTNNAAVIALHLTPSSQVNQYNIATKEKEVFGPVEDESIKLGVSVEKRFKASQDIIPEVIRIANEEACNLMLIGTSRSIYQGTLLGNLLGFTSKLMEPEKLLRTLTFQQNIFEQSLFDAHTQDIIDNAKVPVGIFVNKDFNDAKNVLLPLFAASDESLFIYAKKLVANNDATVIIIDNAGVLERIPEIKDIIKMMTDAFEGRIRLSQESSGMTDVAFNHFDLLLVTYGSWKMLTDSKVDWLKEIPSALIIKP